MVENATTSDLAPDSTDEEVSAKKGAEEILRSEIREGVDALDRSVSALFMSGLSAGLDVGFSLLLMAAMSTAAVGRLSPPVVQILVGNMYAIGFVFVVLGRSELFTEQTTLAVLPVLSGRVSVWALLRLWGIVLFSNLIGAAIFAAGAAHIGPALGVIDRSAFGTIALRITDHASHVIFFSALLAGWLMGLLSWLVAAGRDTISQIAIVWLITTCIGFAGLHHAVLGTVEVLAGVFAHQAIPLSEFWRFLLWAVLGNIVGGSIFVALIKYGHSRPEGGIENSYPSTNWRKDWSK
jgi:formate/nitrite transporter FocA (FNT family)